jgi:hypothetical protein
MPAAQRSLGRSAGKHLNNCISVNCDARVISIVRTLYDAGILCNANCAIASILLT